MAGSVDCSWLGSFLCLLGGGTALYYLLKWSWTIGHGFRVYVLSKIWQQDLREYGQWAVVTGSTAGIGQAYAIELARRGLDIILISRSQVKLRRVSDEIESRFKRQTRIIQADFSEGASIYPAIAEQLKGLEIGILVNNVGMNYAGMLVNFLDVPDPEKKITEVVNCNILSVTQMSRLILPQMVERGKGLIINISSEASSQPQPMLTLYSATKICVTYFSRSLNAEYQGRGVTVQCVTPFMVSTNMTHNIKVNTLVKSAASFARDALNTVGYSSFTSGCISHALQHNAMAIFFPAWLRLSPFCVRRIERFSKEVRQLIEERMAQCQKKQE
ncbi:hydroxysteroid (20-beta) dehydrogenase 2 [Silurus meridionalis]|uniref:hydroxysteroid (20-beta) dehydrogenase 2 n=1 Tax=Silurus meridionalis TaxID=175797 RepID=UPI001EEAEF80|nr:hydroxysteroid (20-beta) dehydrogenase 2 [Silurus meridionalis]KAI5089514.1 very-long-chain 3-oxoacyl-CoA reductase [Silurus meridionalis]